MATPWEGDAGFSSSSSNVGLKRVFRKWQRSAFMSHMSFTSQFHIINNVRVLKPPFLELSGQAEEQINVNEFVNGTREGNLDTAGGGADSLLLAGPGWHAGDPRVLPGGRLPLMSGAEMCVALRCSATTAVVCHPTI